MEDFNIPKEIHITNQDMIVSSTDKKGNITYVNDIFCKIAGYDRKELIGQAHNIIRHQDMPKAVFRLLWQRVLNGEIIYAFVKNKAKNGDYYWVKAYVKPIMKDGEVVQLTSYRKPVNEFAKEYISKLYSTLIEYEKTHSIDESLQLIEAYLDERGLTYDQFIDRLSLGKGVDIVHKLDAFKYKNAHIIFKAHILTEIKNKNLSVKVTDCKSCEFGKKLIELENEPFAKTKEWENILKYHSHVHSALQNYVDKANEGASQYILDQAVAEVQKDTIAIFDNLAKLVDTYKG